MSEEQGLELESVSEQRFRDTLARWPSGVTVVTARDDDEPVGMTAASFSSLSLDPPLVLVCVAAKRGLARRPGRRGRASPCTSWDRGRPTPRPASRDPGPEKFDDYPDERGPFGAPLLPFGVALLVCAHHAALDGGDHTILIGRVVFTGLAGTDPLIYCNRGYWRISAPT